MESDLTEEQINALIGKTVEEADRALPPPYFVHPSKIDDDWIIRDCAFRPNRLSVVVKNGIITEVGDIG